MGLGVGGVELEDGGEVPRNSDEEAGEDFREL